MDFVDLVKQAYEELLSQYDRGFITFDKDAMVQQITDSAATKC